MTKESLIRQLRSYSMIPTPDEWADDIEKALKENNLEIKNLITVLIYNRDTEIEISLFTTPNKDIKLHYAK